jgi:hypothetical protein
MYYLPAYSLQHHKIHEIQDEIQPIPRDLDSAKRENKNHWLVPHA